MLLQIKSIRLPFFFGLGTVNCYLVETDGRFYLVDTGTPTRRSSLERELEKAGCKPGDLKLILITHGDFDHIGNAAYLRRKFDAKIVMHPDDVGMAEQADMFWNRKKRRPLLNKTSSFLIGFKKDDRFKPDLLLQDGQSLAEFGLDAVILSIPGHSKGSIAILAPGDVSSPSQPALFCGDLLENTERPAPGSIVDNPASAQESLEKLKRYSNSVVYPGHGNPFPMEQLLQRG